MENTKFYEALPVQSSSIEVPDGTTPAACSAGACLQRCRTACGGRRVNERMERDWLNGEQACLDEIPNYMTSASCTSVEGADVGSLTLINDRFRSGFGSNLVTCTAPPAPATGAGHCTFTCVEGTQRAAYSGTPPIACTNDGDCASRCNAACGAGKTCLVTGATPAPTPAELPKCVLPQAGAPPTPGSPTTLTNPLNTTDIGELIARFIRAITGIAGSMALLMLVVGGVMWMTAEGSDRVGTAQTIIKNACLGLMLIFLAYSLTSLFLLVLGL